jgi:hypothetical protein
VCVCVCVSVLLIQGTEVQSCSRQLPFYTALGDKVLCIIMVVEVSLQYMLYCTLFSVLCTKISRKFILLFISFSMVNFKLDFMSLNLFSEWFISVSFHCIQ